MEFLQNKRIRKIGLRFAKALLGQKKVADLKDTLLFREEFQHLLDVRLKHLVEVNQPLILISQIQRSGGTLLSQLFDAHPQCHAHPYELYIGYPTKSTWPVLDLAESADTWFRILFEQPALRSFRKGYQKYKRANGEERKGFPFIFLWQLQRNIFHKCVSARAVQTERDILNCYMTSYFNAWLDNQNLYGESKKYVTAFVPRMSMEPENLERFFGVYPDGLLISIVREPRGWYASARKHDPKQYGGIEAAIGLWKLSAESMIRAKERYGDRVYVISFEDLVGETETTMRNLACFLGLDFTPVMLTPTFNGMAIEANSSHSVKSYGVIKDPLVTYKQALGADEMSYIERQACELYERVLELRSDRNLSAV